MNQQEAAGPIRIDAPELAPGEKFSLDFRNRKRNGMPGWYREYLPLDYLQVSNASPENLEVRIDDRFNDRVVPNAVETYADQNFTRVRVVNEGGAKVSEGAVTVTVAKTPYDADDRARESRQQGQLSRVVENLTGIRL